MTVGGPTPGACAPHPLSHNDSAGITVPIHPIFSCIAGDPIIRLAEAS